MSYDVRFTDSFKRNLKTLAKKYPSLKNDLANLVIELSEKPDIGTPLGSNMFKIRMSIESKAR